MKSNVGTNDRVIRLLLASLIASLYFTHIIPASMATAMLIIGGSFVLTGLTSFCPIYTVLGIDTCETKEQEN